MNQDTLKFNDLLAAYVLGNHQGIVRAIAFQPGNLLLASASEDGWLSGIKELD